MVGKVSSILTQGMYSVATPFHPFGGAVDIIVVKQHDGTFRSTPWYVRFGKFQGVLKGAEKVVQIEVNGVEADFHMHLDNSGEAYFVMDVDHGKDSNEGLRDDSSPGCSNHFSSFREGDHSYGKDGDDEEEHFNLNAQRLKRVESDAAAYTFYEFSDEQSSVEGASPKFSEYSPSRYDTLDSVEHALESQESNSEVVLVSVDGHILTAPLSSEEKNGENVQLSTPQFHLGPGGGTEEYNSGDGTWGSEHHPEPSEGDEEHVGERHLEPSEGDAEHVGESRDRASSDKEYSNNSSPESKPRLGKNEIFKSCLELPRLVAHSTDEDQEHVCSPSNIHDEDPQNKSPRSPSGNHETETTTNPEISRTKDESSPSDSGCPISVSLPDSQAEAATCSDSNDPAPEVEHSKSKHVTISTEAPQEFTKSDTDASETWIIAVTLSL